jgi:hypothetical protein
MKKVLVSIALVAVAPFAWGQVTETKTTTTGDAKGTITEYTPGSVIVVRESSGPVRYPLIGNTATYVTRSGRVLDNDAVRTRIKVGVPVRVHYIGTGPDMVVDRVILDED